MAASTIMRTCERKKTIGLKVDKMVFSPLFILCFVYLSFASMGDGTCFTKVIKNHVFPQIASVLPEEVRY